MRFTHKPKTSPQEGDKKTVTRFLWLPLRIGDETRWLEPAEIEYTLIPTRDPGIPALSISPSGPPPCPPNHTTKNTEPHGKLVRWAPTKFIDPPKD